ncbi:MAG TPA: transglutaminase family protein [Mycobacteriales bacterium]|nr:transglutaminase family protein [Mycobacteriales bacterium]
MTWRLEVVHQTRYAYEEPVQSSYNEARVTPMTDDHQLVVSSRFSTEPRVAVRRYVDYWGSQVTEFEVLEPHQELVVTSTMVVETEGAVPPGDGAGWDDLADPAVADRHSEFLAATTYTAAAPELVAASRELAASCSSPVDAAVAVSRWVNGEMAYVPGATGVHTDAREAWEARRGVCQDFAHVAIVALRAMGVPSRYVSGYLHPAREPGVGERRGGESHAWVEVWTGEWWGFDPTNLEPIGHRHVAVARGRDYADVAPVRGVHSGGGAAELTVEVTSTLLR